MSTLRPPADGDWLPRDSEWTDPPACGHDGCEASATPRDLCLRHLPEQERNDAIAEVLDQKLIDLRGLRIDEELWRGLVEDLERVAFDTERRRKIWFSNAIFEVPAFFFGWRFSGSLNFDGARFEEGANFYGAVFERNVSFASVTFRAGIESVEDFRAEFADLSAEFEDAIFEGGVDFNGSEFDDEARFFRARFSYEADFRGVTFKGQASFQETEWAAPQRFFGPMRLGADLNLRRAYFERDLLLEAEGGEVNCEETRLGGSLTIRARGTALTLEHLDLTNPALVVLAADPNREQDGRPVGGVAVDFSASPAASELPKILSLRDSNVLGLTISSGDLRQCLFQGVRNIDRMTIEGQSIFAQAPKGRSERRILVEESIWRLRRAEAARTRLGRALGRLAARGWHGACAAERRSTKTEVEPAQLSRLYRGLRKSLEESKDYAGASDLYYGEMEMRLRTRSTNLADRAIIAVYWLLSGYGVRASRSLLALSLTLAAFAALFATLGFAHEESYVEGLLHSARSAALFPQGDELELTQTGEALQIALRVVGPALIGLTALALRARVKR